MKTTPSTPDFVPAFNISSLSVKQIHEELLKRREKETISFCINGKLDIIPSVHVGFSYL